MPAASSADSRAATYVANGWKISISVFGSDVTDPMLSIGRCAPSCGAGFGLRVCAGEQAGNVVAINQRPMAGRSARQFIRLWARGSGGD